jgi:hypothetical protein
MAWPDTSRNRFWYGMTSLITDTCLSLRPVGLSAALGRAFCRPVWSSVGNPGRRDPVRYRDRFPAMAGWRRLLRWLDVSPVPRLGA